MKCHDGSKYRQHIDEENVEMVAFKRYTVLPPQIALRAASTSQTLV